MPASLARRSLSHPASIVRLVRSTGGVFGLRPGPEVQATYGASKVANNCQGSARSVAQAVDFGTLGLKVPPESSQSPPEPACSFTIITFGPTIGPAGRRPSARIEERWRQSPEPNRPTTRAGRRSVRRRRPR